MTEPKRIILPTIFAMQTVNAWLFKDPEPILIDCGENTPAVWEALNTQLEAEGLTIFDIKKVIITHAHVDHIGMAGRIAKETGAEIWVNEFTKPWAIEPQKMWDHRSNIFQNILLKEIAESKIGKIIHQMTKTVFEAVDKMWEDVPQENIRVYPSNGIIELGGEKWQSIYTPGHSNTQSIFYNQENKWLLSADMILKVTPSPVIDAQIETPSLRELALPKLLDSYKMVRALAIEKAFPGHYEVIENTHQIIDNQINRIHKRKEQVFSLLESGTDSFLDLFSIMYNGKMNFPGMGMLLGYLDLLELEGRVEKKEGSQIDYKIVY